LEIESGVPAADNLLILCIRELLLKSEDLGWERGLDSQNEAELMFKYPKEIPNPLSSEVKSGFRKWLGRLLRVIGVSEAYVLPVCHSHQVSLGSFPCGKRLAALTV
jgi:hypothetical protein